MRVYKEKQFLIFDFEDGQAVKYDFAARQAIGKSGKPVKDLRTQLKGIKINDVIESCVDEKYGKYLNFYQKEQLTRVTKYITLVLFCRIISIMVI